MSNQPQASTSFEVAIGDDVVDRILARVADYRFYSPPSDEGTEWSYGVNTEWLRSLCSYWTTEYDWRRSESNLNRYPQFLTRVEDVTIHYVKVEGEANGSRPLLLLHGWPGSHYEFWGMIDQLAFPTKHGGSADDAFDVVIASLPGYGFSGPVARPIGPRTVARLMDTLMTENLGFPHYMVQGGDWGSVIGSWIGNDHSTTCAALHLNLIGWRPTADDDGAVGELEKLAVQQTMANDRPHLAYAMQHATRPQTLGIALHDTPVGTAAWIIDKFHDWSDLRTRSIDQVYSKDDLLTNIMIYLVNDTIATSLWAYRGNAAERAIFSEGIRCATPTAIAKFPFEPVGATPPRSWVDRHYNVVRWTEMPGGGHFAALERPELLLEDVRAFGREAYPARS
jgi:pimeloyl-ACP methyl ester carboxylesterase